ncbi:MULTISPECIES: nucleotidyltransferase family protein [unclassified Rhodanobacter]|uniref:nucleotidyltransferase family protein n=1 Tax=unclassified Rhodanobacter TaxID=2621553 RepID=UPI001BDF48B8|nr:MULTISPECIES: nucleotidyltransferase family protein [unclassified Rhodanobacter]MBT2144022.1 nucleotidyltransferase family protein [Rhodanobacter sp. LX-99]MBT2146904.1 nucleotidyltransferase family protein [Rhodanobacter sp. LX-100]
MLPPLRIVRHGLRRITEAFAAELAGPGRATPAWSELEWRLATAVAVAHGVSPLLCHCCAWKHESWRRFLESQRDHVELRHQRIAALLQQIDAGARAGGLAVVPLKGSALHALGIYTPGERPMADIDLLVREDDAAAAIKLLLQLGYVESFAQWKHRVFKPATGQPFAGLGEHRDTPVNIELHTGIRERLPVSMADITARIYPRTPRPGLNPYPSNGALMSHLLLHAAGNMCGRSLRLLHLHDIARLAMRLSASDWEVLWADAGAPPWWALPPLRLAACHYPEAIPAAVLARLERDCPLLLRAISRRQSLTRVSCSELWLHAFAGIEWSRSLGEAGRYLRNRASPPDEARRERADMARTQLWLQGQGWVTSPHRRRVLTWLTRPVPRMDIMYAVRAALEPLAPETSEKLTLVVSR